MKAIKIIIVVVVLATLGYGIFRIVDNKPKPIDGGGDIEIPEGCEGVVASATNLIESSFAAINDGEFEKLKQTPDDLRTFFVGQNVESDCMVSVNATIRNRYLLRFIAMTNTEFAKKDWNWNSFLAIEEMTDEFLKESADNGELKSIKTTCGEYRGLVNYKVKVYGGTNKIGQSQKRPKTINDRWDYDNTKNLVENQPSANEPAKHTSYYEKTRKDKVRTSLHEGNVAFIDALVNLTEQSIKDTPTDDHYRTVVNTVSKEITAYQNKASTSSFYNLSKSVVDARVKAWNDRLTGFYKYVEEAKEAEAPKFGLGMNTTIIDENNEKI